MTGCAGVNQSPTALFRDGVCVRLCTSVVTRHVEYAADILTLTPTLSSCMVYHLPKDSNLRQSEGVFLAGDGATVLAHGGQIIQHDQAQNAHVCHEADGASRFIQSCVILT